MLKSSPLIIFILFLSFIMSAHAGELRLDYSSFYSHLRKIDDEQLRSLEFAFGFVNVRTGELCTPQNALVHTDKKDIPVSVNEQKRFVLPTEKALKLAKAQVHIQLAEANNQCDLSVLLQVKPELLQDGVDAQELQSYFVAFEEFFHKMGGFLSFMMPSPEGLNLKFRAGAEEHKAIAQLLQSDSDKQTFALMQSDIETISKATEFNNIESITAFVPGK